ncbi:Lrp/AsnC family transcriptional regulator [Thiohalomonas denitrificans]|uniref:Lrp/AsnC family transcriptional regulator n=1 Tax=Thiohalomonas denitrificans TaxID=415747 RepID=UPI0026F11D77|nr:AsnC family transcriptional regulator [Thiohalomonas denitrificans]
MLNELDRRIINELQRGFPVSETPYADVAGRLGTTEAGLLARLQRMLDDGTLTRFGPLYHAEKMGGGLTLAAMAIPAADFESVAESVNGFPEVAHNYARDHRLNMWFVLATESPERVGEVIAEIEQRTGYPVYNMPKQEEFFVGLHFGV